MPGVIPAASRSRQRQYPRANPHGAHTARVFARVYGVGGDAVNMGRHFPDAYIRSGSVTPLWREVASNRCRLDGRYGRVAKVSGVARRDQIQPRELSARDLYVVLEIWTRQRHRRIQHSALDRHHAEFTQAPSYRGSRLLMSHFFAANVVDIGEYGGGKVGHEL